MACRSFGLIGFLEKRASSAFPTRTLGQQRPCMLPPGTAEIFGTDRVIHAAQVQDRFGRDPSTSCAWWEFWQVSMLLVLFKCATEV